MSISGPYTEPTNNTITAYIYFPPAGESMRPVLVWSTCPRTENLLYIWVSRDKAQAERGLGDVKARERLIEYSDDLWGLCEEFTIFREQVGQVVSNRYHNLYEPKKKKTQVPQIKMFDPLSVAMRALERIANEGGDAQDAISALKLIGVYP